MRLALILLYLHFFINGTLVHQASGNQLSLDVAGPRCTRVLQPLIVAAQLYDIVNTHNQFVRYPGSREIDWWSSRFAGPKGRSIVGIAFGIALLDEIKWRLTARSPAMRCAVEANQLETTIDAIRVTQPR